MLKWLTGKKPIPVWVIKQVDDGLLHLCGQGSVVPQGKRSDTLSMLHAGRRYQGAVDMAGSGLVLNARLCDALVPLKGLKLDAQGQAHWGGHAWQVSQVPQRCWTFEGRLTVQRQLQNGQTVRVSTEDVTAIRQRVRSSRAPVASKFGFYDVEAPPLLAPKDATRNPSYQWAKGREWRNDDD